MGKFDYGIAHVGARRLWWLYEHGTDTKVAEFTDEAQAMRFHDALNALDGIADPEALMGNLRRFLTRLSHDAFTTYQGVRASRELEEVQQLARDLLEQLAKTPIDEG